MVEEWLVGMLRLKGAPEEAINQVKKGFRLLERGEFTRKDLYDFITGILWNYKIPLTPREASILRYAILLGEESG